MRTAICPGSFDPITVGHLDLVERASRIFDEVIVCVMANGEKRPMFTLDERLELVRGELAGGQSQQELELRDELIIGTDPLCDIGVQDNGAALRHVRLFSVEGAVYVEALDFSGAAHVNGEGLQETRRLRSGDEVTVGSTVIRLKF